MALYVPKQKPIIAVPLREDLLGTAGVDFLCMHAPEGMTQELHDQIVALFETASVLSGDEIARLYSTTTVQAPKAPEPAPEPPEIAALTAASKALSEALARTDPKPTPPWHKPAPEAAPKKINGADRNWSLKQPTEKNYASMMRVQAGRIFYALRSINKPAALAEIKALLAERDKVNPSAALHTLRQAGFVTSVPGETSYLWSVTEEGCRAWDAVGPVCFTDYQMQVPPDRSGPGATLQAAWQDRHNP